MSLTFLTSPLQNSEDDYKQCWLDYEQNTQTAAYRPNATAFTITNHHNYKRIKYIDDRNNKSENKRKQQSQQNISTCHNDNFKPQPYTRERNLTAELTWGETANTQVKGKKTTPKQSRCFALTSIELLGIALFITQL